jgi:hypothetical protein
MKNLTIALTAVLLMTACSKPFLVGKKHHMVVGPNKPNVVKIISLKTDSYDCIDVIYVNKNGDTCSINGLTQPEFKRKFKIK